MRVLLWHGWLLDGSGSNVYTAKTAEVLRRAGHDVVLLCQEPHPAAVPSVDRWGEVGPDRPPELRPGAARPAAGRLTLLRPRIGTLLPVFVLDEYEGFRVKRFVDLSSDELDAYLAANVDAMRTTADWHRPEAVITGHAIPGAVIARRALGPGRYVAKIHGSDLEYAIRLQQRYRDLAREGLEGAVAVTGAGRDVLRRAVELVPSIADRVETVAPGVEVEAFRPRPRAEALTGTADRLQADPDTARGRPDGLDAEVERALARRDGPALDALAGRYDQAVPDPSAARRLRALAESTGPIVGYMGKFIPQKGVHLLLTALASAGVPARALVVGFGSYREWLAALTIALDRADAEALRWLAGRERMTLDLPGGLQSAGFGRRVTFTGRLDHRYAAAASAMDVLVVPSILDEAFGMVAAEGAAAGAFPLVARHSGLAEVAGILESSVGRPGLFSFEPGPHAASGIAAGVSALLRLPHEEREELRRAVTGVVRREWTWERAAERLLDAATISSRPGRAALRAEPPGGTT